MGALHSYQRLYEMAAEVPKAIPKIAKILKDKDVNFCFIGGAALPRYGYHRATTDIDILIYTTDKEKVQDLVGTYFRAKFQGATKKFIWNDGNIPVDFIFSNEITGDGVRGIEFGDPKKISELDENGVPFISLRRIIENKLSSWKYGQQRRKDAGDVEELIKINRLPKDFGDSFRSDLKDAYLEIWAEPREETDSDIY